MSAKAAFGEKGMRLVRLWETILLLVESDEPCTAKEINEKIHLNFPFSDHKCNIQTTREDLKTLLKCGFPISIIDKNNKEIFLDEEFSPRGKLKNIRWKFKNFDSFDLSEIKRIKNPASFDIISLSLIRALLNENIGRNYPFYKVFHLMLNNLWQQLNKKLRAGSLQDYAVEGIIKILGRQKLNEPLSLNNLEIFTKAIAKKNVLKAVYKNRENEVKQVVLAPLAVWFSDERAYILAAGIKENKMFVWRIDRFSDIRINYAKKFPDIDEKIIEEKLNSSFKGFIAEPEYIKLRVKPEAVYLFEEFLYHPSQKTKLDSDGSLIVGLNAPLNWGLEEWILGFGEFVVVEKPEKLKQTIIKRLQDSLSSYTNDK